MLPARLSACAGRRAVTVSTTAQTCIVCPDQGVALFANSYRLESCAQSSTPPQLLLPRSLHVQVTTVEAPTETAAAAQDGTADIYVGKGRYIKDDPRKYPGKDDFGPLTGATGEWRMALAMFVLDIFLLVVHCQYGTQSTAGNGGGVNAHRGTCPC